ncbi:cytochrome P450 [Pseudonocardia eucalypti]|uniref:Cytochrome P450 n=1 Tax=Pseudonocardia eucalypti TaxID=648755 RepID=A0ABP9QE46_9PSEU|nr:cytochrome P450 [Pseudonocardia eucalypti]
MQPTQAGNTPTEGLKEVRGPRSGGPLLALRLMRDPYGMGDKLHGEFGPLVSINVFGIQIVNARGPEAAEQILVNRDRAFASGPGWSYFIGPFFNRGIMLLDFDEHLLHRRIMQSAFTPDRLRAYSKLIQPNVREQLDRWSPGPGFRLRTALKQLTLDLALEVFVGLKLPRAEADRINKAFIDAVLAGTALVRMPVPGLRWHRGIRARKVLEEFFYSHIEAKRRDGGDDLFAALCAATTAEGERFSDEDVVNHMIFLLMAAHDTTTITMTTMSYYLAKHPEWQRRAREQSLGLGPDLGYEQLGELVAVDRIMKESLRLCPPVPGLPRRAIKDTEVLGYRIPEGSYISPTLLTNHFLPEYWSNPTVFDPDRFSPERAEDKVHKYAWHPFGGGVHKCIGLHFAGMQVKTIYHELLQRFEWSVPDDYTWPIDYSSLPFPRDGLPVDLRRR